MSSGNLETRNRILKMAWKLLEKHQGQNVSIEDIAKAAGVSRQAVYLHFASRAELLIATVRYVDEVNHLEDELDRLRNTMNGLDALDALIDFWGNYIPRIHRLAKALLLVRDSDKDAASAWEDRMTALRDGCMGVVGCMERDGTLRPDLKPEEARDLMWSLLSIGVWDDLTIESRWTQAAYISGMKAVLRRVLAKNSPG